MNPLLLLFCALCVYGSQNTSTSVDLTANDLVALNYALTLEHLESYFYSEGLKIFNKSSFVNTSGSNSSVYTYLILVSNHETAHVNTISQTIHSLGGVAVPQCTYNFTNAFKNVSNFLATARILENTGVMAYDGAINTLNDLTLRTVAASIATVEARHAAYLNQINGFIPFPSAFDNATQPTEIVKLISPFIIKCPYTIRTPVIAVTNCTKGVVNKEQVDSVNAAVDVSANWIVGLWTVVGVYTLLNC